MAVTKKRKSKTKKKIRKQVWKQKACRVKQKALALGLSILSAN